MRQTLKLKAGLAVALVVAIAFVPATGQAAGWWNPFKKQNHDIPLADPGPAPPADVGNAPAQTNQTVPQPLNGAVPALPGGPDDGASDTSRADRLEASLRKLTGQIEQLTFQLKQTQDQLKRLQEDNEYRFQALEGGKPGQKPANHSAAAGQDFGAADSPAPTGDVEVLSDSAPAPRPGPTGASDPIGSTIASGGAAPVTTGAPPAPLGTLTIQQTQPGEVRVVGSSEAPLPSPSQPQGAPGSAPISLSALGGLPATSPAGPAPSAAQPAAGAAGTEVASIAPGQVAGTPTDTYGKAYQQVLDGDYVKAEASFRSFLIAFPSDKRAPDAQYWLADSFYQRGMYREAAQEFNSGYRAYPKSTKAPDSLLRLGMSLNALGNHEAACASYGELVKRFPNASNAVLQKVKSEQASGSC